MNLYNSSDTYDIESNESWGFFVIIDADLMYYPTTRSHRKWITSSLPTLFEEGLETHFSEEEEAKAESEAKRDYQPMMNVFVKDKKTKGTKHTFIVFFLLVILLFLELSFYLS